MKKTDQRVMKTDDAFYWKVITKNGPKIEVKRPDKS